MSFDVLHNFISPVTGRVLSDPDYVLVGDYEGIATPSPILIDMRLELIDLRKEVDDLESLNSRVGFIISEPDEGLPKAQALSSLDNGFMYNTDGVVSTNNDVLSDFLLKDFLWIGDELNKALPVPNIEVSNLPNLTENKIWVGDNTNRPVEKDFSIAPDDAKYIIQQENPGLANAQILGDLTTGILKNTTITGILSIASGGGVVGVDDYVTPLALEEAIEAQAEATTIEITEAIEAQAVITTAEIAASAAATEAAAFAAFRAEMLPFAGVSPITIGLEISAAIVAAETAANTYTNTAISGLTVSLDGDISGSGLLSSTINTTFVSNPVFTGNESMTIPFGTTAQRPSNSNVGMIRINTEI